MDELEAGEAAVELDDKEPQEVLSWAIDRVGKGLAICCSFQADGCALIDIAHKIDPKIRVFTVVTGRMPQETYDLIDKYRPRYGIKVEIFMPDAAVVQQMLPSTATIFSTTTSTCACYAARRARCCRCAARSRITARG